MTSEISAILAYRKRRSKMSELAPVDNSYPPFQAESGNLKLMIYFIVVMLVATQKEMSIYYITEAAREPNSKKQKQEDERE